MAGLPPDGGYLRDTVIALLKSDLTDDALLRRLAEIRQGPTLRSFLREFLHVLVLME